MVTSISKRAPADRASVIEDAPCLASEEHRSESALICLDVAWFFAMAAEARLCLRHRKMKTYLSIFNLDLSIFNLVRREVCERDTNPLVES